jgi:ribosomal protein L11 methyltransferase
VTYPERWFVLTARTPSRDLLPLVAEGLVALGGASVLEDADSVTTFLPPPPDPDAFAEHARRLLASALPDGEPLQVQWRWQPNEDWIAGWKQGLAPRRITGRLTVKPTWCEWDAGEDEVVIDIDPQMAFGTGEHATTRGCLRLLDGVIRPGYRVVDVGSGSAVLAIAAARLGAAEVVAIEFDADANLNARENLELNDVQGSVRIVEAMADARLFADLGTFDMVVANILSSVIRPLLPAFRDALAGSPDGRLIVSGILRSEHQEVVRDARAAGFELLRVDEEEEWWSGLLGVREAGQPGPSG